MNQRIDIEIGGIKYLPEHLEIYKPKSIFLISGKSSFKSSGAKELLTPFLSNYRYFQFSAFSTNPKFEDVVKGIKYFDKIKPDTIIAVGGGSVIDMAKNIRFLSSQKGHLLLKIKQNNFENIPVEIPLIVIPTTAGSGSESTMFSVLYINNTKFSIENENILPTSVIIDPVLLKNSNRYVSSCALADAICHSIESIWSINSTDESKYLAVRSLRLINDNFQNAFIDREIKSLHHIALASNLAGRSINLTRTTAAHSVSYPITIFFNVPHGHAVALTILRFMKFNSLTSKITCNDPRGHEYVKESLHRIYNAFNTTDIRKCQEKIYTIFNIIGLDLSLKNIGIHSESHFNLIIKNGFSKNRMENNPRKVSRNDLYQLLNDEYGI